MHPNLYQAMADLSRRTPKLLMIVAVVVFVLGYTAHSQFLEPEGVGAWHKFRAAIEPGSNDVLFCGASATCAGLVSARDQDVEITGGTHA